MPKQHVRNQRLNVITIFVRSRKWLPLVVRPKEVCSQYRAVRNMLGQRGIKPENLPPEEDIKKIERRVASEEKKLAQDSGFSQK